MKKAILVATCVAALSAFTTVGASAQTTGPAAQDTMKTNDMSKDGMKKDGMGTGATGTSMPSAKDSSTQGASTAGSAEKKGDATTPGGTMKK
ncbi:hypothetical protein [Bradyrhizobium sp.]|jgi:pentapeptide MXKDX repeat protein|uniref:hypothetical protein n=1 Tax=Bradyrhizobium sp. TaxID=376 RepID=UPI002DF75F49|nr:hypothetical protein [Bradyrhizobium sp.]